jgi:transposase
VAYRAAGGQGVGDEVPGDRVVDARVVERQVRLVAPAGVAEKARVLEQPGRGDRTLVGAYSSRANRDLLRLRGITAVIAQPSDQAAHRKRRGRAGARPPAFDVEAHKGRNVVERSFNAIKQWRGLATRYDKLALTCRGGVILAAIVT